MKIKKVLTISLLTLLAVVIVGGGYVFWQYDQSKIGAAMNMGSTAAGSIPITQLVASDTNAPTKTFNLTAEATTLDLGNGKTVTAWTYNGTSPGPELRVQQGDRVVVHLTNKLPVGVTIHWHGVNVPGTEDGIAGVTQDAVKPGATFTYTFIADQPGTYWYHSHQDSSNAVGRGLYGVLVVEPKQSTVTYDRDYSVAIHEWDTTGSMEEDMGNMNMSGSTMMPTSDQSAAFTDMMSMYDAYTVNQTSAGLHLDAKPGESVRLRLVNTGNMTHLLTAVGAKFQVIALDGHDLVGPTPIENELLPIGAGQRYDISFRMPEKGSVQLVDADPSATENKMISATIGDGQPAAATSDVKNDMWFDFTKYGTAQKGNITLASTFTKTYDMNLGAGMGFFNGKYQMVYTINGKVFPNIPPITVNKGDLVKVTITNNSKFVHPMHLHGHTFEVLSKGVTPLAGSPVYLDTLNVLPGESYVIAFQADNPGLWMFHCHDLHHASAGMDTMVTYDGISTPFTIGSQSGNHPE